MHCEYEEPVNVSALFGSMVFNDSVMRERLPRHIYTSLKRRLNRAAGWKKAWRRSLPAP